MLAALLMASALGLTPAQAGQAPAADAGDAPRTMRATRLAADEVVRLDGVLDESI